MKRKIIVSSILSGVLMFNSLSFVFAKSDEVVVESKYEKDVQIMTSLGFMDKFNSTDINAVVKRGEFAAAVTKLAGIYSNISAQTETLFSDVNETTQYCNDIYLAAQYGIITGSQGKFYPDEGITFLEAATMLINALGYKEYASAAGGYPTAYSQLASSLGIYKNVDILNKVTVGSAARMMLNAGEANVLDYNWSGGFEASETLFEKEHDIYSNKGILNATEYTSLDNKNGVGENTIKIGDSLYNIYYSNATIDYLGYNVKYYYRTNDDGENTVLYIEPFKTDVEIINGTDYSQYSQEKLYYYDNNKLKQENIPASAAIIYNGRMTNSYYITENGVDKSIFETEFGEIKLINNDTDGEIDVVNILSYEDYVVSNVNKQAEKIFDMYDQTKVIDYSDIDASDSFWIVTDDTGMLLNFVDVKEKSVLSVAKSLDGKVLRAVMSTNTIKGEISSIDNSENDNSVVINGTKYKVHSSYLKNNNMPGLSTTVTAYLDFEGNIAGFERELVSEGYGYIIRKPFIDYDDVDESYSIRLMTADSMIATYKLAKSVTIDGTRYKKETLDTYMSNFAGDTVVLYKMNKNKEITMIDTPNDYTSASNDILRPLQDSPYYVGYYNTTKNFDGTMLMDANTVVFSVPSDEESKRDTSLYSVYTMPAVEGQGFRVRGFVSSEDSFIAECIQLVNGGGASSLTYSSPYMLVEKVKMALNNDDEVVLEFTGYNGSGKLTTVCVSSSYKKDADKNYIMEATAVVPGDIIKYVLDAKKEIVAISPIKVMNSSGLGGFNTQFPSWFSRGDFAVFYGYLMSRDGSKLALVNTKEQLRGQLKPDMVLAANSNANMYYVKKSGRRNGVEIEIIEKKDYSVLADYMHSYQTTPLILTTQNGVVQNIYIYEEE